MDAALRENPFTPTFGEVPVCMAGRDELLNNLRRAFSQSTRSPYLATLITGARGSGKTALLSLASQEAQARGWISVNSVARPGLLEDILITARRAARHIVTPQPAAQVKGIGIGQVISVEWENAAETSANWRSEMTDLLEALDETETGLLITVDEVQPTLDEMIDLVAVYQLFVQERRKVALLMAGLPHNVLQLLQDKTVSFTRRAQMVHLDRLEDHDVELALRQTVEVSGRGIDTDALSALVEATDGFPFMMQLVGFRAWDMSPYAEVISLDDARLGAELAKKELKSRIVVPTYLSLSEGDKRFLAAMATVGTPCKTAEVARALGKTTSYATQYKNRLLDQSVIREGYDGSLDFEIPTMKEFIEEIER